MIRFELAEIHETINYLHYDGWAVFRYENDVRDEHFVFFAVERVNAEKSLDRRRRELADGTAAIKAEHAAAKKAGGVWCRECDKYHPAPKNQTEHAAIGCLKPWEHEEVV